MELKTRTEKGAVIVSFQGRFDYPTMQELEQKLSTVLQENPTTLVLSLDEVEFISSAGLQVILNLSKKIKEKHGQILLVGLNGTVRRVFELSGLNQVFETYDTTDEALDR
jgi:anti-anti-sigma factor